jgi:hypothetical protein
MFIAVALMSCIIKVSRSLPRWIGSHVHCSNTDVMPYESFTRFTQDGLVLMFIATLIGHDVSVTAMNMRSNPFWVNHVKF